MIFHWLINTRFSYMFSGFFILIRLFFSNDEWTLIFKFFIQFLRNEDYSNLIFFKLNQLLIENKSSQVNTSLKVFKILNTLARNSTKLAQRLFQIVFNTQRFLQLKENNQFNLTKKFQELILSNANETDEETKYDILIDYYVEAIRLTLNSALLQDINKSENGTLFINNCIYHLSFSEYLLQLFKVI